LKIKQKEINILETIIITITLKTKTMKYFLQHKKPQMTFAFIVAIYLITQLARV
jgi:hypothetical protein